MYFYFPVFALFRDQNPCWLRCAVSAGWTAHSTPDVLEWKNHNLEPCAAFILRFLRHGCAFYQARKAWNCDIWKKKNKSLFAGFLTLVMRLGIISSLLSGNKGPLLDLFYLCMMCNILSLEENPRHWMYLCMGAPCVGLQGPGGPDRWSLLWHNDILELLFPAGIIRDYGWQKDACHMHGQSQW